MARLHSHYNTASLRFKAKIPGKFTELHKSLRKEVYSEGKLRLSF